jgi:hypothetical protein
MEFIKDYIGYLDGLRKLTNKHIIRKNTICYKDGLCELKSKIYEGEIYGEGEIAVPAELDEPEMEDKDENQEAPKNS